MKPVLLVFMGGQGSGKGTFAKLFLKQHNYKYIETGAILRDMPEESELRKKMARGELVSDNDLFPIVSEQLATSNDVVLDGFPRTLAQAQWLIDNYADKFDIQVIYLNISEQAMLSRIQKRLNMGENRKDDTDETAIQKRIAAFKTSTMPAIEWLRNIPNIKFFDIPLPGDDIDINFALILQTMGQSK